MSELANYSIETDHTVLLSFKDGRRLRVPVGQLDHHLAESDLDRVRKSLKLRRDFIHRHMPRVALVVAATGLIGILTVGTKAVAQLINPPQPKSAPEETGVVRNQIMQSPAASPMPSPAVKGASSVAVSTPAPSKKKRKAAPKIALPFKTPKLTPTNSTPAPIATPNPVAGNNVPSPTPLPAPQIPNQGDVLGDSTGPVDNKPNDPGPLAGNTPTLP
jgi:hypothetical protein